MNGNDKGYVRKYHYKDIDRDFDIVYEIHEDGFLVYDSYDIESRYFKREIITHLLKKHKPIRDNRNYASLYKELSVKNALHSLKLFRGKTTNCFFKFKRSKFKEFIFDILFKLLCKNIIV